MPVLPPLLMEMRANSSQAVAEIRKIQTETGIMVDKTTADEQRMQARVAGAGKSFQTLGKYAGIGAVAVVGASVYMASTFQQKMNLLRTAADEPAKRVQQISTGVLTLAQDTGTSIDQLAEGAYTVSKSMGSQGAAAQLNVLKAAAEGAKAENVDLATSTNALTSVMMSYHVPASQAVQVENEMVAASGKAKTTMQEFAGSLSTVLPVASAAHISFAQVGGAIATLTQHGTSADEATQELSSTIRSLQAPSSVAVKALNQIGLNSVDISSKLGKRGLTGTIQLISSTIEKSMGPSGLVVVDAFKKSQSASADLQTELSKMPPSLKRMSQAFADGSMTYKTYYTDTKQLGGSQYELAKSFLATYGQAHGFNDLLKAGNPAAQTFAAQLKTIMGGATGMNTALMLGGENMKTFTADTKDVGDAAKKTGSNVSSWAQTQKTLSVQADIAKEAVSVLMTRVGTGLLPVVTRITQAFSGWVKGLMDGNPAIVTLTSMAGALAGALVIGAIAVTAYNAVQGVAAVLSGEVAAKTMLQATALGVVRGAQLIATAAQWAWNAAMDANPIGLIILAIGALIAVIVLVVTHWKQVTDFLKNAWSAVGKFFQSVGAAIVSWWNGFWSGLSSFVTGVVKNVIAWVKANWPLLLGILTGPLGFAIGWIVQNFGAVEGFFRQVGTNIRNVWTWIWSGLGDVVRSAFSGAMSIVKGAINVIIGAINGVIKGINGMTGLASAVGINIPKIGTLPSLDVGGRIPGATDQPVLMIGHGGEEVLSNDMLAGRAPLPARAVAAVMQSVTNTTPVSSTGSGQVGSGASVTVNAFTNASPVQIASEVGWQLRRMA